MQMFEILISLLPDYEENIKLYFKNNFHKLELLEEYYLDLMRIGIRAKLAAP